MPYSFHFDETESAIIKENETPSADITDYTITKDSSPTDVVYCLRSTLTNICSEGSHSDQTEHQANNGIQENDVIVATNETPPVTATDYAITKSSKLTDVIYYEK